MDGIAVGGARWKVATPSSDRTEDRMGPIHQGHAQRLREASEEFEGYFIAYLMRAMRGTIPTGLFANKAGQMFYSWYDQEIGRLAAQADGLGLARLVESHYASNSWDFQDKKPLKSDSDPADTIGE